MTTVCRYNLKVPSPRTSFPTFDYIWLKSVQATRAVRPLPKNCNHRFHSTSQYLRFLEVDLHGSNTSLMIHYVYTYNNFLMVIRTSRSTNLLVQTTGKKYKKTQILEIFSKLIIDISGIHHLGILKFSWHEPNW